MSIKADRDRNGRKVTQMDDHMLLRRLRRRDPSALEAVMDRYLPYVRAIVGNVLRTMPPEDVEEVTSDVFLALWQQNLRTDNLKAWLGATARNRALNRLRQRTDAVPLEGDVLVLEGPEQAVQKSWLREQVQSALDSLGEPDRELFLRHYYYFQTVAEIAQAMDLNENTVKSRLFRGRQKLKATLEQGGF